MSFHRCLIEDDLHAPSNEKVINNTSNVIPALTVVKYTGVDTTAIRPEVEPISSLADCVRGITREEIQPGQEGFIAGYSILSGIDTSQYIDEQKLYSDANGNLILSPTQIFVAQVLNVDAVNGAIFVRPETVENNTANQEVYNSGEAISANLVVYFDVNDNTVKAASASNNDHIKNIIGIATTSTNANGQPIVILRRGIVEDAAFNFPPGVALYLGENGVIQTSVDAGSNIVQVGRGVSNGVIDAQIQETVRIL